MQKSKIKTVIIALLTAAVIVLSAVALGGCEEAEATNLYAPEFEFIDTDYFYGYHIAYDTETKVMYAVSRGDGSKGCFCALLNADGTPKLYQGE